jgi:hypothetical protein
MPLTRSGRNADNMGILNDIRVTLSITPGTIMNRAIPDGIPIFYIRAGEENGVPG